MKVTTHINLGDTRYFFEWEDGNVSIADLDPTAEIVAHKISNIPVTNFDLYVLEQMLLELNGLAASGFTQYCNDIDTHLLGSSIEYEVPLSVLMHRAYVWGGCGVVKRKIKTDALLFLAKTALKGRHPRYAYLLISISGSENSQKEVLEMISKESDLEFPVLLNLVRNKNAPLDFKKQTIRNYSDTLALVALKYYPEIVTAEMVSHLWGLRQELIDFTDILAAKNIEAELQFSLLNSMSTKILAQNPHINDDTKIRLSQSKDPQTRIFLAEQKALPIEAIENLSKDPKARSILFQRSNYSKLLEGEREL